MFIKADIVKTHVPCGLAIVATVFACSVGLAEDRITTPRRSLAEIEVTRAEIPKKACRFTRRQGEEYSLFAPSWPDGLKKPVGQMSLKEAADFVLAVVAENFAYDRTSLVWVTGSPITEQGPEGAARRVGWFVDVLQAYQGVRFGDVQGVRNLEGGVHAMLENPPAGVPELEAKGPSVDIDVILWKVVREHGEATPVLTKKQVQGILLRDFAARYPHAGSRPATFAHLELAYLPKQDDPKRWVPRWLAKVQSSHPGSHTSARPMKPIIHSYTVDAWIGKILSSKRELVPTS